MLTTLPPMPAHTDFQQQFRQIKQNIIAVRHCLISTLHKSFTQLKHPKIYDILLQRWYFQTWIHYCLQHKVQKLKNAVCTTLKQTVYKNLFLNVRRHKNIKMMKIKANIMHWNITKKMIFGVWKQELQLSRGVKCVLNKIIGIQYSLFMRILKWRVVSKNDVDIKTLMRQRRQNFILKSAFQHWVLFRKIQTIINFRKNRRVQFIIRSIYLQSKQNYSRSLAFDHRRAVKSAFIRWNQYVLTERARKLNQIYVQKKYFKLWSKYMLIQQHQLNIGRSNSIILNKFLQTQKSIFMQNIMKQWRRISIVIMQKRKENAIIVQYAKAKEKQMLLKLSFNKFKLNVPFSKIAKFYQIKLKKKIMDGLKITLLKQTQMYSNVIDFINRRQLKRYFEALKLFNENEKMKVIGFRMRVQFNRFSLQVAKRYYNNKILSQKHYENALIHRYFTTFHEEILLKRKQKQLVLKLNVVRPFTKWRLHYRVQNYMKQKYWGLKKQIFREWRIANIRYKATTP